MDVRPDHKKRWSAILAQIITISILLLAFGVAVGRKQLSFSPATTPQDAIYNMFDAARAGDVRRYLSSYTGPLRASLDQSVAESGQERFSGYLKESSSAVKGLAVSEPEQQSEREMKVRVEYVYQDRNEAQTIYLQKDGTNWKIYRLN